MKRRTFITLLGSAAAAWPVAARGQQAMPVIGYFSGRSADTEEPLRKPFLKALEELGFPLSPWPGSVIPCRRKRRWPAPPHS